MEYVLSMTFITSGGLKSTLSVSKVKANLSKAEINSLMDTIVAKNIFITKSGTFVKKESAQITERKITKFDVA